MIDSHFHLADEAFASDLETVVARARDAGLRHGLCVLAAQDEAEAARGRRLASIWPEVRFAVGIHPHQAGLFTDDVDGAIGRVREAIASTAGARAVGEIGLDYHYDFSPRPVQVELFGRQVQLACELDLPVVIHTREATEDTFRVLRQRGGGRVRGVFHCFSGDPAMAREALALGFAVSFAGLVTFPRAEAVRAAARLVPGDNLLVETDAPYLSPVPFRGTRNEPARVVQVAEALARVRSEPLEAVDLAVTRTFERLFRP